MERVNISQIAAPAFRILIALSVAILCTAAGGSTPPNTVVVGSPVQLAPIPGFPMFLYTPVSGLIADLNGDGAQDIILGINGTSPVVYLNNGTAMPFEGVQGAFITPPNPTAPGFTFGVAVLADVNADGHPDLAVAGFNAPSLVYLNNGTSTPFAGVNGIPIGTQDVGFAAAFGDVNGDGFLDMAIVNSNHVPSRVYLTHGAPLTAGTYSTAQIGTDVGYGQDVKIADVNGDGLPDLILAYQLQAAGDPSGIAIYLNNGTDDPFGNVAPIRLLVGQWVNAVAVADLNNDGKPDLVAVVTNSALSSGTQYVFLNSGSLSEPYGNPQALQPDNDLAGGCLSVSVADLNADGHPDLMFSCAATTNAAVPMPANAAAGAIYLNNGTSTPFNNVAPIDIPATASSGFGRSVAAGKLVNGGATDILLVDEELPPHYNPTTIDQVPLAQNDSVVCPVNGSTVISVLANDSAAPGESLNVGSLTITSAPQHGTTTVNSTNGSVTYLPAHGFSGSDNFQYTVRDNVGGLSNVASVNIEIGAALSISPLSLAFPSTTVGSASSPLLATIKNTGATLVSIGGVALTGSQTDDFALTNTCGSSLALGASCTVSATFKPVSAGAKSATISIADNATGSARSVMLTGTGTVTGAPAVGLSVASLNFASQSVGTASPRQTVTLTNTGTASLMFSSLALVGGQADDFSLSKTCGASLAIGASCSVSIVFKPVSAGAKSAIIRIADNASGSPSSVMLTGTGTVTGAPAVGLSVASLNFASQAVGTTSAPQTVTLTNTGTASLMFSSLALVGGQADDFILSKTCGTSLAVGASCSLSVIFKPVSAGAKSASVGIGDNASNPRQSIALAGTGH